MDDDPQPAVLISRSSLSARRELLAQLLGGDEAMLASLDTALRPEDVVGNIENFVGAVPVPLALTGPFTLNGTDAQGDFVIPMATLEGTIAASYSRGAKMMNLSGGCETVVSDDYFIRSAQFLTASLREAGELLRWCRDHSEELGKVVESSSQHLVFRHSTEECLGASVVLSIFCETGDAMGSNMVSNAIGLVAEHVTAASGLVRQRHVPSPQDKKNVPAQTKGKKVVARALLRADVMRELGRVELAQVDSYIHDSKNLLALHGASSLNIQAVNGMAGLFQAFGQDMAYLGECSQVIVDSHLRSPDELEVTLTVPTLIVATVGGGTGLPPYRATLSMVGCYGTGRARKLAELMAAFMLAGEISCVAALCSGEFIPAHETMGKNPPEAL